jgi:hypothetical protein
MEALSHVPQGPGWKRWLGQNVIGGIEVELTERNVTDGAPPKRDGIDVLPKTPCVLLVVDFSYTPPVLPRELVARPKLPKIA